MPDTTSFFSENDSEFGVFTLIKKVPISDSSYKEDVPITMNDRAHQKFVDYMFSILESDIPNNRKR